MTKPRYFRILEEFDLYYTNGEKIRAYTDEEMSIHRKMVLGSLCVIL